MNAHVLVTGANGFLGSEITRLMLKTGYFVRATDCDRWGIFPESDYVAADILRPQSLKQTLDGIGVVIHAAGLAHVFSNEKTASTQFSTVNEIGTSNVVRVAASAGAHHFVLISSVSIYGGSRDGGAEDSGCYPKNPYAQSKYQAEQRAISIANESGMTLTILRLATLFGEGDRGNVARLMRTIDRGHFIWIGNGSNRKSLLHREDAARACLKVIQSPASGMNIYNVSAPPCTMREVVEGLAGALGKRIPAIKVPASWAQRMFGFLSRLPVRRLQALGSTVQKWLDDDVYDGCKFANAFDFQPRVSLEEGLRREVDWYRSKNK